MKLRDLAAAACAEVASREKHYPAMIEAEEIGAGEAAADLAAWRAIAALLPLAAGPDATGWTSNPLLQLDTDMPWPALEAAARGGAERLAERAAASPTVARRRASIAAIAARLAEERWFWTGGRGPRPGCAAAPKAA